MCEWVYIYIYGYIYISSSLTPLRSPSSANKTAWHQIIFLNRLEFYQMSPDSGEREKGDLILEIRLEIRLLEDPYEEPCVVTRKTSLILYKMCFSLQTFWQWSLLHSMIFNSNVKNRVVNLIAREFSDCNTFHTRSEMKRCRGATYPESYITQHTTCTQTFRQLLISINPFQKAFPDTKFITHHDHTLVKVKRACSRFSAGNLTLSRLRSSLRSKIRIVSSRPDVDLVSY